MSPDFYQKLVDRCWRRSGTLLYRPNQKDSCCPHYTLRLDAAAFKPSRDQRQAVNRFNKYVIGEEYAKAAARLHPRSREEAKRRETVFDLVERVHEAESRLLSTPPEPAHDFTVTLEPDTFTEEKYAVFENYQRLVHQEPPGKISRTGFKRFLCNSPLRRKTVAGDGGHQRELGSFHQCYRLDGKLVAIGVLDLLPECVSAVYFLYHESISRFSPGKLGAMREIALALEGGYRWWYSGYYIHSCPKMRYKIDYSPQYVLDPETLAWDLLDRDALAIFDKKPYVSLSRERLAAKNGGSGGGSSTEGEREETSTEQGPSSNGGDEEDGGDGGGAEVDCPLLGSNMPGIMSPHEVARLDLDHMAIRTDFGRGSYHTQDMTVWESQDILDFRGIKGRVAELVAAMGADLIPEVCLDFRRHPS